MSFPYIIQGDNITVVINNTPHTINKSHPALYRIKTAIKDGAWDVVESLMSPAAILVKFSKNNVTIKGDNVYWGTELMHSSLSSRMMQMFSEGFDIEPMVSFMNNLMLNPSRTAITELYSFLEACNLPITPDGYFLAYKKVRNDFKDIHSNTMDNSPGKTLSMPRDKVDAVASNTCSSGLHFCSYDYLSQFGNNHSRVVIVKVNPRDVVSIPTDYKNAKGRACKYKVISEVTTSPETAFTKVVESDNSKSSIVEVKVPRTLSMTANAIRKRHARANKK